MDDLAVKRENSTIVCPHTRAHLFSQFVCVCLSMGGALELRMQPLGRVLNRLEIRSPGLVGKVPLGV